MHLLIVKCTANYDIESYCIIKSHKTTTEIPVDENRLRRRQRDDNWKEEEVWSKKRLRDTLDSDLDCHSPYGAIMTNLHLQTHLLHSPTSLRVSAPLLVYVCMCVCVDFLCLLFISFITAWKSDIAEGQKGLKYLFYYLL